MDKPEYLYHGDRIRMDVLEPGQAVGFGEQDCRKAVYAVAVKEWAIPFALTFQPTAEGAIFSVDIECSPPRIRLKNAVVEWDRSGYLYILPSDTFEQVDEQQWVSYSKVVPIHIERVDPEAFREWVDTTS